MAIELLLFAPPHCAIHDAESLIYVLLFLCSHLDGPNSVRSPPDFDAAGGQADKQTGISSWFTITNLNTLGYSKQGMMTLYFSTAILAQLSPYFEPLKPHICKLWATLFPGHDKDRLPCHSNAKLRDVIDTLKTALLDGALIETAQAPNSHGKRMRPGELLISKNGWDALPSKRPAVVKKQPKKRKSFLKRGQRAG
jgi:hypothetical protein